MNREGTNQHAKKVSAFYSGHLKAAHRLSRQKASRFLGFDATMRFLNLCYLSSRGEDNCSMYWSLKPISSISFHILIRVATKTIKHKPSYSRQAKYRISVKEEKDIELRLFDSIPII